MSAFENKVAEQYRSQGWTVFRSGWPDMLCVRSNIDGTISIMAVEAKTSRDLFRGNQKKVCTALSLVMPVREVREGPGYGDTLNRNDMHALVIDGERSARFETEKELTEWLTEREEL